MYHLFGAGVMIVVGSQMLAYMVGPLAFINKYEKWKYYARSSNRAIILSLSDLISLGLIPRRLRRKIITLLHGTK